MKKGKFTEHQIVSAIRKQEAGIPVKDIAREMGISEAIVHEGQLSYNVYHEVFDLAFTSPNILPNNAVIGKIVF
jgi:hypothetical protein